MSTRERILTIRLLEKVKKYASYANALGIEAVKEKLWIPNKTDPKASGVDRK